MPVMCAKNGVMVQISFRAALEGLPRAFTTEQNGSLFKREKASGRVLVEVNPQDLAPNSAAEFKGQPFTKKVVAALKAQPDETRLKAGGLPMKKPTAEVGNAAEQLGV